MWMSSEGEMINRLLIVVIAVGTIGCGGSGKDHLGPTPSGATTKLSGGKWFDGQEFVSKTFFSVSGVLTTAQPARVDAILDLSGKFVIPPYADAHVHNLNEDDSIDEDVRSDQLDGVFYAMEQDPAIELSPVVRSRVNTPESVDVVYTQGLVTPSWGVMADMYTMLARMGRFKDRTKLAQLDTREVFLIDDETDLEKKWPALSAKNRDFIKVIVAFSEEEGKRKRNPHYGAKPPEYSAKAGIDPQVLASLVGRAHAAGLRVSAHIETAADFRLALKSGVDIIAHLPASWQIGAKTGFTDGRLDHWKLTDEDAQMAFDKKVVVITTTLKEPADPDAAKYREVYRHNLSLLAKHGAKIAIGTDSRGSAQAETLYLSSLGVFDNRTLLRMLTGDTPHAIFPGRKIGELRDGYEASFLACDRNPLEDMKNIKSISIRFKQGHVISVAASPEGKSIPRN
jgi:hypothetical protein